MDLPLFVHNTLRSVLDGLRVYGARCSLCLFVVANFDAPAQANDIRIERRQVVVLC